MQARQFFRDVGRQQIGAGGQRLAEFDENRPQVFQGAADAYCIGRVRVAEPVPGEEVKQKTERAEQVRGKYDLVQPMPDQDAIDIQQAQRLAGADHVALPSKVLIQDCKR